ncbi:Retrovirus-related Pol polyprotein from transposon 17.6 [Araneus ventricosus]|uniref:Retrovirus-related Pol polyprotein from transposon 17.6 n=1 Tax=Araneus ventricosus TaxID=182803 RepID=A0A4Y2INQ2_ARAVE|nr:Retrovirus-related Pol polyprotein from transposon 17.6 [Araneus ventricosus]
MSLQERLLRESDLTLKKAAEFLRASEASKHQIESVKSASKVHEIQKNRDKNSKGTASYTKNSASDTVFNCQKCGKEHKKLKCPAYGKICSKCKRKNHFAAVCKTVKKNYRSVNNLENDNSSNSGMNLFIDSVTEQVNKDMLIVNSLDSMWLKKIDVENNMIEFKLDTGAEINVLPLSVYKSMCLPLKCALSKTNITLISYGNFKLNPEGELILNCSVNQYHKVPLKFVVVNVSSRPILGLSACQKLNLIKKIEQVETIGKDSIMDQYSEVFKGLGEFPGKPYHIEIKSEINAPRRVPQSLHKELEKTLNELVQLGIVSPVNKTTEWGKNRLIIAGKNREEHDKILLEVLERAKENNIKFNPNKFQFRIEEVKYMDLLVSKDGIKADPSHVRAINEIEKPTITSLLRVLLKKDIEFQWNHEQETSFEEIKRLISSTPVLKVFNDSLPITIQCDSSKDGLGACLLQERHPVSFASRSLTDCEKNYAQIEKELLAIVFSFEKYHNLVYGHKVLVESDHQPLTSIVQKLIGKITTRLQRMLLKLLKYIYDFTIKYVPGSQMYLADTLSRASMKETGGDDLEMFNVVHSVSKLLPMSESRFKQFQKATEEDKELQMLFEYFKKGWPEKKVVQKKLFTILQSKK